MRAGWDVSESWPRPRPSECRSCASVGTPHCPALQRGFFSRLVDFKEDEALRRLACVRQLAPSASPPIFPAPMARRGAGGSLIGSEATRSPANAPPREFVHSNEILDF